MPPPKTPAWSFLTNHAQVLLCIEHDPGIRLRDIGETVGVTERAVHRIVGELACDGYISRERTGRRNRYTIQTHLPLPDPLAREQKIGDLLAILARQRRDTTTPTDRITPRNLPLDRRDNGGHADNLKPEAPRR